MDYEADGMFFDYLFACAGDLENHPSEYVPESTFWADYTGTLSGSRARGTTVTTPSGAYMYHGAGLANIAGAFQGNGNNSYSGGALKLNSSLQNLGGKQYLQITGQQTNGVPLMWNAVKFASAQTVKKVRYVSVV